MVVSSGASPSSLDILSHVNLSHGIPADVSVLVPTVVWITFLIKFQEEALSLCYSSGFVIMSSSYALTQHVSVDNRAETPLQSSRFKNSRTLELIMYPYLTHRI